MFKIYLLYKYQYSLKSRLFYFVTLRCLKIHLWKLLECYWSEEIGTLFKNILVPIKSGAPAKHIWAMASVHTFLQGIFISLLRGRFPGKYLARWFLRDEHKDALMHYNFLFQEDSTKWYSFVLITFQIKKKYRCG